MLDGNSRLNLATFVTTWMEPQAQRLMSETFDKNMIDKDEYPRTAEIEMRCVNMLSRLWNSPDTEEATGTSTTGSSEAAMLGGMALKWRWRDRQKAAGKPTDTPNMVMGSNVQICWEKFCRYWDVEARLAPMEGDRYHLNAEEAVKRCDENTIGVVPVLGSTFDGSYEPVADICAALDTLQADTGLDVPVHVDAASGGFIAPFLDPDRRLGLPPPPGAVDQHVRPQVRARVPGRRLGDLAQSRRAPRRPRLQRELPGRRHAHVRAQLLTAGQPDRRAVLQLPPPRVRRLPTGAAGSRDVARFLADSVGAMDHFELLTDGSELPVFAFTLKPGIDNYTVFDLSERLRDRGWLIPAYSFPENRQDLDALRIVVRNGMSRDLADLLVADLQRHTEYFDKLTSPLPDAAGASFSH